MSTQVMRPAELEYVLRARIEAIRAEGTASAARRAQRRGREGRRSTRAVPSALVTASLMLLVAAASVIGSHGGSTIDLTSADAVVTHQNSVFVQGGVGAGTGTFDPFLTLQSNDPTEQGYNICDDGNNGTPGDPLDDCPDPQFDEHMGGGRTHELLASAIPVITYQGVEYREFSLDANDQGSDTYMSVDDIRVFLDSQKNLTGFNTTLNTFSNDTGTLASLVFDLDQVILLETQSLESGSGVSDITVLLPNSLFPADCAYGSLTCTQYVYFYTESGFLGTDLDDGRDYDVSAGFEEWRVRLLPVVNVSKTANESFNRDYPWTIDKTVIPTTIDMFDGAPEADVDWSLTPTRGTPTESGWTVSGSITITNPTGGSGPIASPITATINSVTDVVTIAGTPLTATVSCPVTFPTTLTAGSTLTCTYTRALTSTASGTNTATANINNGTGGTTNYSATVPVDFTGATVTETNESATVTDPTLGTNQAAVSGVAILVDGGMSCPDDDGSHLNTATVTPNDGGPADTDDATVVVNCHQLTVSKTVNEALTRNYTWTIDKTVLPTSIDMFDGAPEADVDWSMTPTRSAPSDAGWTVSGTITITNPAPIAASGVSVTDVIDHPTLADVNATVDCSADAGNQTTVNIAAESFATCSYAATLSNGDDRTNTATATLFAVDYDSAAMDVDFTGATVTETNESATVTDPTLGTNQAAVSGVAILVDGGMSCPDDDGSHLNTATVTPNDGGPADTDDATVVVNCHQLTVSKTATTTFARDYDWDVTKERVLATGETDGDDDLGTLVLDENQSYTLTYRIVVSTTGYTDSNWAVAGTITINNPAPIAASGVSVTDVIDHPTLADVNATVDCSADAGNQTTVNIAAESFATCSYSAPLSNADARTNVATATLFAVDYDSAGVPVTFDNTPDVEIDECVTVTDDNGTPANLTDDTTLDASLCISELDDDADGSASTWTFTHTIRLPGFPACGPQVLTNTAHVVAVNDANDTGELHNDSFTVNIDVPCPQGCTLTQGYWKTHNASFWGGAPADESWFLLGDVDGDLASEGELETFFLSGGTYFDAMWTAPGGNVYYQLSRQYIAAVLNTLDGADAPPAVDDAIADAEALFETYTPAQVAAWKGKAGKEQRAEFVTLAGILASFNEGLVGPGHCDEDGSSATASATRLVADRRQSASTA